LDTKYSLVKVFPFPETGAFIISMALPGLSLSAHSLLTEKNALGSTSKKPRYSDTP
jgi:hypothetical protein